MAKSTKLPEETADVGDEPRRRRRLRQGRTLRPPETGRKTEEKLGEKSARLDGDDDDVQEG